MNQPLKGVGYDLNATNRGFSFSVHDPAYVEPGDNLMLGLDLPTFPFPVIPYFPIPQFQCFATPGTDEYVGKTILKIVCGGVNYTNSNLPLISEGVKQNFSQAFITKAAVLSTGVTAVSGAIPFDQLNPFMLGNGFYTIDSTSTKHYIVLSYYDGNGVTDFFDVPILTQRTPWVSIVAEGSAEFDKLFIEQGPSYYNNFLNIAPMVGYINDDGEVFGQNHTGYFKPIKFGANVRILATVEDNVVTQSAHGTQNLAIPLLNHGTSLVYAPGMTYYDDPYNRNSADDFNYVVNKADIEALSSLSFTGAWWSQITDNSTPRAVTVNNYSYYSVNFEGTDNMREFSCAVVGVLSEGESPTIEHRLRIKNGLVTFKTVEVNVETGIITVDPLVTNLRINAPNIYPEGTNNTGSNDNPDYISSDGYIQLEAGNNYYVFLYKVVPNWNDAPECKAPQLVISKAGGLPDIEIKTLATGGSYTANWLVKEKITLGIPVVEDDIIGTFNNGELSADLIDIYGYSPHIEFPEETINVNAIGVEAKEVVKDINLGGIGYTKSDCYRKDIAYIYWNAGENRFIVRQLHTGPVVIEDTPIHLGDIMIEVPEEPSWEGTGGIEPTVEIVGAAFEGYTKSLNTGSTNQSDGSTTAGDYLPNQPSQIESPEIT
jgi:hypothetical protein